MFEYTNSNSDMLQESYVLTVLDEKPAGYYVELGSGDPVEGSNTFLLEKKLNWKGLAIDNDRSMVEKYNNLRSNECIETNALTFDYKKYFEENDFPKVIDYLQIDIDHHETGDCMLALLALPMMHYRFRVITIEHDLCRNYKWESMRAAQREILSSLGYRLTGTFPSEDWWIDRDSIEKYKNEEPPAHTLHAHIWGRKELN